MFTCNLYPNIKKSKQIENNGTELGTRKIKTI